MVNEVYKPKVSEKKKLELVSVVEGLATKSRERKEYVDYSRQLSVS